MRAGSRNLIVVGQGAAGLAAALTAAEASRDSGSPIKVTLVDKAAESEAGGNTRWSPSNMRMAAPDRVEPTFVQDMLAATNFQGNETYFAQLAKEAPATVKWLASHGIEFIQPPYYLAKGPPRIQPVGGGPVLIKELTQSCQADRRRLSLQLCRARDCHRKRRHHRSCSRTDQHAPDFAGRRRGAGVRRLPG